MTAELGVEVSVTVTELPDRETLAEAVDELAAYPLSPSPNVPMVRAPKVRLSLLLPPSASVTVIALVPVPSQPLIRLPGATGSLKVKVIASPLLTTPAVPVGLKPRAAPEGPALSMVTARVPAEDTVVVPTVAFALIVCAVPDWLAVRALVVTL
jgi:hypothetical protein